MSRATALRGLSFFVAIVVCVWFALGIRQPHDTAAAAAILTGPSALSSANAARASSLLDGAALLNPDRQVARNVRAWLLVDFVGMPAQRAVAVRTLGRLIPLVR